LGVCHGPSDLPPVEPFFCDLRKELNRLNPSTILPEGETRGVTVSVRAWIGDAPARCWMCGTKGVSGFYSCPRCKIRGVHPQKKIVIDTTLQVGQNNEEGIGDPAPSNDDGQFEDYETNDAEIEFGDETNDNATDVEGKHFFMKSLPQVKFPTLNDPRRHYSEWKDYLKIHPGETDPKMVHRKGPTPLDKIKDVNPINDVPLEVMHLLDIGVLKDTIVLILHIPKPTAKNKVPTKRRRGRPAKDVVVDGKKKKKMTKITPARYRPWNCRIRAWSKLTPVEFGRRCRSLESFNSWKATEYRQFFYYYMPALMYLDRKNFDNINQDAVLHLLYGTKLLRGNSHIKKVSDKNMNISKQHLTSGFNAMAELTNYANATPKGHGVIHILDDALYFQCRLDSLSAYAFENQMIFFRQMGLQGTRVIEQIKNRLLEKGHLHDDLDDGNNTSNYDDESIESFYAKLLRHKASRPTMTLTDILHLPPFFVHSFDSKKKIVYCESFTIKEKFPDNVVRLYFENHNLSRKNAFCIEEMSMDNESGQLFVTVREFAHICNTFSKPFPSHSIRNFRVWGGLKNVTERVPFARIIGKYFSFPMFISSKDIKNQYHPRQVNQRWILQEIDHAE
jgi:hypothetical protein